MQLEWFRHHKKFVYAVLAPLVIISFALLFGQGDVLNRAGAGSKGGPSVSYRVGSTEHYLSPAEVVALRFMLTQYGYNPNRYRDTHVRSSDEAAYHMVSYGTASAAGFAMGADELKDRLRDEVKSQIQQRDGSQPAINDAVYRKLLEAMQMTPGQFERMTQEFGTIEKYMRYVYGQARANDEELFISYLADREVVRLRYKELKSEDYLAKAKAPAEDKIKEFYDEHKAGDKEVIKDLKDVMFSKPKLSADLLFMDTEKTFADMKPSEKEFLTVYEQNKATWKIETKAGEPEKFKPYADVKAEVEAKWKEVEVKKYYERYKRIYWKIEPKAGEKAPPPGEEKFKPFEEVKAEAEKKWHGEWTAEQQRARMETFKTEFADAEKAFEKEQEGKKAEEKKTFDVAAWAKSKNLVHWTTDQLYEEQFDKGKDEVNAKDAKWAAFLFSLKRTTGTPYLDAANERQAKQFGSPQLVTKGGQGLAVARIKEYKAEEALPLDQAKEKIAERLKIEESIDLAEKDAKAMKEDWAAGKNVPPIDSLEEIRGDHDNKSPILKAYFRAPKPIGEPIEVSSKGADESPSSTNLNRRFYVAFPVERELPTRKTFHDDTIWARDQKRAEIERANFYSLTGSMSRQFKEQGKVVGDVNGDPPLFDEYRRGKGGDE
jgi:hypothetical protein